MSVVLGKIVPATRNSFGSNESEKMNLFARALGLPLMSRINILSF